MTTKAPVLYDAIFDIQGLDSRPSMNTKVGAFPDTRLFSPWTVIGFTPMHADLDYGATREQPWMAFKAVYWSEDAAFLASDAEGRIYEIARTAELVNFRGDLDHGLLPRSVANQILQDQHANGSLHVLLAELADTILMPPKLVWGWEKSPLNPEINEDD